MDNTNPNRHKPKNPYKKLPPDFLCRRVLGESLATLSKHYNVDIHTCRAWEKTETFETEMKALRDSLTEDARTILRAAAPVAVQALTDICNDLDLPPMARIRAATEILNRIHGEDVPNQMGSARSPLRDTLMGAIDRLTQDQDDAG